MIPVSQTFLSYLLFAHMFMLFKIVTVARSEYSLQKSDMKGETASPCPA